MNDPLSIIDHISITCQLRHNIGAGGQIAQVDLTVGVSGELLGAVAPVHGLDLKYRAREGLVHVGAVHLDQLQPRLGVIEKDQRLDAASGHQLHFLIAAVQEVAPVAGVHLHGPVGAGLDAGEEDLSVAVRFIPADGGPVPEDLEGDAAHAGVALPVVFHHLQSDLLQVLEHQRPSGDGVAVCVQLQFDLLYFIRRHIIGGRNELRDGVLPGLDVLALGLGGVPPLDVLQNTVFIGVKLIIPVGHGGELEGGRADTLVGVGVPLEQDGLSGRRRGRIVGLTVREYHARAAAAAGKLLGGQVRSPASPTDIGQLGGVVLRDLETEGGVCLKLDAHGLAIAEAELQPVSRLGDLIGEICIVFGCGKAGRFPGGVSDGEPPLLAGGDIFPYPFRHL